MPSGKDAFRYGCVRVCTRAHVYVISLIVNISNYTKNAIQTLQVRVNRKKENKEREREGGKERERKGKRKRKIKPYY